MTQAQAEAALRAAGQDQLADMLSGDERHARASASTSASSPGSLGIVACVYLVSAVFALGQAYVMAGVAQRTIYRLRQDVDTKLAGCRSGTSTSHPRGDMLSRVTNDIDNISQTLQQSLTQLITSVLTVIGMLVMMFWISPLLAAISLLTVPALVRRHDGHRQALAEAVRRPVGADRHAQRARRGDAHRS